MEAMPRHDPIPPRAGPDYEQAGIAWQRYKRLMKWMVAVALATSALALLYLHLSGEELRLHMVIATIAGVAFTVLVGTGLMGLVFLSNRTGHDDKVDRRASSDHDRIP